MFCRAAGSWILVSLISLSVRFVAAESIQSLDVEPVWTGHRVEFSLLTAPPYQYVAYYDAQRQMTVAQRRLDESRWTRAKLPSQVGWDSHNYVTMDVDRKGDLHVAGNMHCVPLVYFRTTVAHDVRTLCRVPHMVGPQREKRVTYPVFLKRLDGQLIFRYRDGSSGNGDDVYNLYDESTGLWRRLLDRPLTSGQGRMNAYCSQPRLGPDGRYHIVWVWRDTPDCATNHDLSYASSADLVHWTAAGHRQLSLPITIDSESTVVDPVAAHQGLINGGFQLGFDSQDRPLIAYHKYDRQGNSQIFVARFEEPAWVIRQVSDWENYRWDFSGGGSIPFEVRLGGISTDGDSLRVSCTREGRRYAWYLDQTTLARQDGPPFAEVESETRESAPSARAERHSLAAKLAKAPPYPGLAHRWASDRGASEVEGTTYRLHWYSLGPNRDRPRPGPPSPPVMLQVVEITGSDAAARAGASGPRRELTVDAPTRTPER